MFLCQAAAQAQQKDTNVDKIGGGLGRGAKADALERRGDKSIQGLDFFAAMKYYGLAIASDSANAKAYDGYGDAAAAVYLLAESEKAYTGLLSLEARKNDPEVLYRLAAIKMLRGDLAGAENLYQRLLTGSGVGTELRAEAQKGLDDIRWVQAPGAAPLPVYSLEPLSGGLNDFYYSEYALDVRQDTLYYASFSFPNEKDDHQPKRALIKVLSSALEADTILTKVEGFNEPDLHTAHAAFSPDGQTLYYTICKYVGEADIRCDLYARERLGLSWGPPVKLPAPINAEGYSTTQPRIAVLPDRRQFLYFASNRPGSQGMDIWGAPIRADGIGEPVRLGDEINTPGNEFTPFYDRESGHLYFSSDGHRGFGGQDIFRAKGAEWRFDPPQNVGNNINSRFNEICFIKTPDNNTAYFASNRGGNIFSKDTICCYDLYRACLTEPAVSVQALDAKTGRLITNPDIQFYLLDAQGKKTAVPRALEQGGRIMYKLQPGTKYVAEVDAPFFIAARDTFETPPYFCETLEKNYRLQPVNVALRVRIFNLQDQAPIAYTQGVLQNLSEKSAAVYKDSETFNSYEFPLEFNRRYQFRVSKTGFYSDSTQVDTQLDPDLEKDTVLERDLYLLRGVVLIVEVFHEITLEPLDSITICQVELNKGGRYRYKSATNLTGNLYSDYVEYGKRYHVYASRPRFKRGPDYGDQEFLIPEYTVQPSDTFRVQLYLRPARPEDYFPIKLYFDNDRPVPRSYDIATNIPYNETYEVYAPRVEEFVQSHTAGMSPADTAAAAAKVRNFFRDSVEREYLKLRIFTEELTNTLIEDRDTVTIILKGYASPLGPKKNRGLPDYNFNLTERRIACVDNHFRRFPGLNKLREGATPQLRVGREPNGAAFAPPSVSANPKDRRYSVFSAEASHERRVEVVGVVIKPRIFVPETPQLAPCEENRNP